MYVVACVGLSLRKVFRIVFSSAITNQYLAF